MSSLLDGLNDKQIEAVKATKGPLLVIAGAGSGKTRALTHRIAYLIEEKGVSPWQILAVTFTNKAANEMKERIIKLLSKGKMGFNNDFSDLANVGSFNEYDIPTIGTFHSICVRILRKNIHLLGYENSFVIYDTTDQRVLMKRVMKELGIDEKQFNPRAVLAHISNAKNQLIGPKDYHSYAHSYFAEKVDQIYGYYQAALEKNGALDFDDIIMKTVELFKSHPDILDKYQEKYRYISVDEYQDTNQSQYTLVNMLAAKYRNICVIGDDDQSIYSWRGANIKNILDFEKDYSEAKVVKLEQNYRSTQTILDAAHNIISKNKARKGKKLWTENEGGQKIHIVTCRNERHEGEFIAQKIEEAVRAHESPSYDDFVVLYRTNAQSRVLEEVFLRYGIPYQIVGGIKFYERKEIKDILAYLRSIQNPFDSVSLHRIINTPPRKIGNKTLETIGDLARQTDSSFFLALENAHMAESLNAGKAEACEKFAAMMRKLQKINKEENASGVIKFVLENTGYQKFIDDGSIEGESRLENIYELISVASKYDKIEPGASLSIFLEEISLLSDADEKEDNENRVTFMTVHSAKGLEFPNVFVAGLEEGIFPHSRSTLDQKELEEERRLMYVALTRAMDKLYLIHAEQRLLYGEHKYNAQSQFLNDISEDLVEFLPPKNKRAHVSIKSKDDLGKRPVPVELEENTTALKDGDKVHHGTFGNGIIVSVQGGVATIAFEDNSVGIKKLALSIAPLKKI